MGRKKAPRAGSEMGDDKASTTTSVCGRSSAAGDWDPEDDGDVEADEFAESIDRLYEKRASTREDGLRKLVALLTAQFQLEECTFKQDTLAQLLLSSVKKGGPAESALAARCLGLHVITLGASDAAEGIFHDGLPALELVIQKGRAASSRAAAIDALSIMCFVGAEGPHETLRIMGVLGKAYAEGQPEVQASALHGWTLLLTTVPAWQLGGTTFVEDHLKVLAALLQSDEVDVRAAAGEAVALLFEVCDLASLPESKPTGDDEEGMPQRLEDIVARMQDLATNRGDETRRSKKDRASLKGTFRELCCIVEGGKVPQQSVKLRHGDALVVSTLAGNVQLNAFREFLGDGFQTHLLQNSLLHEVFNFRPRQDAPQRMTAREKRMYRSPASADSKAAAQLRKQERQMMSTYKSGMY